MCDYCHIPSTLESALVKNYIFLVVVRCLKRCHFLILCNCSNPTCSSHVYCPNTTQMTLNDNQPIIHPISGNICVHFRLGVCNVQALVFCVVFCRSLLVFFSLSLYCLNFDLCICYLQTFPISYLLLFTPLRSFLLVKYESSNLKIRLVY